jgi:heterodisulfide reductase subunit A-like polyferredoxin
MVEERKRYILEFTDIPKERQSVNELPVEQRINNFNQVDLGFAEDAAVEEARRCLSCRRCLGCGLCLAECDKDAIDFGQADEMLDLSVDSVILTHGVERVYTLPSEKFGYGRYVNVATDIEFERILSDDGPYGGMLIRPFDGEIPAKIGFICTEEGGVDALNFAIHEAMMAKKKVDSLEIAFFCPDEDAYVKELERNYDNIPGITVKRGVVKAIREVQGSKNLCLEWSNKGDVTEEEFNMIVLSMRPQLPGYIVELAKELDIDINELEIGALLKETSKKGVFFAGTM